MKQIVPTAKERQIVAELMSDPDYRAAWNDYLVAVAALDMDDPDQTDPEKGPVAIAARAVIALLDSRPDLAALAEAADSDDH